jgi:hypothetical protein
MLHCGTRFNLLFGRAPMARTKILAMTASQTPLGLLAEGFDRRPELGSARAANFAAVAETFSHCGSLNGDLQMP